MHQAFKMTATQFKSAPLREAHFGCGMELAGCLCRKFEPQGNDGNNK